jgi:hypothetical protein
LARSVRRAKRMTLKSNKKINCVISDTHCGSDRAIFPPTITLPPLMADDGERTLKYNFNQKKIFEHLMSCAKLIKENYKDYSKVIIVNGDAIEGLHHKTIQLSAPMVEDHVLTHIEVMELFLQEVGFSVKNGDELYYGSGTEVHTGFTEAGIAKYFQPYGAKFYDELKLSQNGCNIWFVHQWKGAGDGQNEGDAMRNGLKAMYYNSLKENWKMPDFVIASHFHKATMSSYSQKWNTYYGMITPSLQMKTRFGQKVSAFQRNDIGVGLFETAPNGMLKIHEPLLMDSGIMP